MDQNRYYIDCMCVGSSHFIVLDYAPEEDGDGPYFYFNFVRNVTDGSIYYGLLGSILLFFQLLDKDSLKDFFESIPWAFKEAIKCGPVGKIRACWNVLWDRWFYHANIIMLNASMCRSLADKLKEYTTDCGTYRDHDVDIKDPMVDDIKIIRSAYKDDPDLGPTLCSLRASSIAIIPGMDRKRDISPDCIELTSVDIGNAYDYFGWQFKANAIINILLTGHMGHTDGVTISEGDAVWMSNYLRKMADIVDHYYEWNDCLII